MIKQIPRSRLPHTITHKYDFTNTGEAINDPTSREIQFVKIDEQQVLKMSKDGKEIIGKATLFYDYQNSIPKHLTFTEQDLITFNGREYEVRDIDTLYGNGTNPHHYEIILV